MESLIINNIEPSILEGRTKEKRDIINIWIMILERMLYYRYDMDISDLQGECAIIQNSENSYPRVYIFQKSEDICSKIMTILFPFSISQTYATDGYIKGTIEIKLGSYHINTDKLILIKSVLDYVFNKEMPLYDAIINTSYDYEELFLDDMMGVFLNDFMIHILSVEDGYIRYDFDPERSTESESNFDIKYIHPLHHLDIFCSNSATFKIGLNHNITWEIFNEILNPKLNRFFLDKKWCNGQNGC